MINACNLNNLEIFYFFYTLGFANLSELIAKDRQDYIDRIVHLARSPEQIIYYKQTIREKYLNSAATNMESFSNDFAEEIKNIWEQYLTSKNQIE